MGKRMVSRTSTVLLVAMLCTLFHWVEPVRAADNSVTVKTSGDFMTALSQKKSSIIVDGTICIGDETEASGRMLPVKIPGNTVISGTAGSTINSRSPIQLEGDSVVFQSIALTFDSSDALGSVPHREIFLAGHSLTMDNVSTYLAGNGGALGPIGGSEEELLPTVYAGGYPGTQIGNQASLTVTNSNDKTMFKGIYMSHGAESDNKEPYYKNAVLNLDSKVIVRETVYAASNAKADINVSGEGYARTTKFSGNVNTTFTLEKCSMYGALVKNIGNVILDNGALLEPQNDTFSNITIKNNACLDLNEVPYATVQGDFEGLAENKGILVLDCEGILTIEGTVSGVTQFQTGDRNFPGKIYSGRQYIKTTQASAEENFVLAQQTIENGFELLHSDDGWWVYLSYGEQIPKIGKVEIVSAPKAVDLKKIRDKVDDSALMELSWYDQEGNPISSSVSSSYCFYDYNRILIKTEYLNSTNPEILQETNWGNAVYLEESEENPNAYYLCANQSAYTGDYTFLFCEDEIPDEINNGTVEDVQNFRDSIKASWQITFYDSDAASSETAVDISGEDIVVGEIADCSYTGAMVTPAVQVTNKSTGETLETGRDYVITYENNIDVGENAVARIIGTGNYTGEREVFFCIEKADAKAVFTGNDKTALQVDYEDIIRFALELSPWKKSEEKQATVRFYSGDVLLGTAAIHNGRAVLTYHTSEQMIPIGTSTIHVAFDGTAELNAGDRIGQIQVTLRKKSILASDVKEICLKDLAYDGSTKTTQITSATLKDGRIVSVTGKAELASAAIGNYDTASVLQWNLLGDTDEWYQLETPSALLAVSPSVKIFSEENGDDSSHIHHYVTQIEKASLSKDGSKKTWCPDCKTVVEESIIYHPTEVILAKDSYVYDKKGKKPSVIVKDRQGKIISADSYTVTYTNNVNIGRAKASIFFRGNYSGTIAKKFSIVPKGTSLSKVSLTKRGLFIKWKKQKTQTSGYIIQYSASRRFTKKTTKTVTVKRNKTTSTKIRIKKPKKKYYVKVCTYKTIKEYGKRQKIYSRWSKVKKIGKR